MTVSARDDHDHDVLESGGAEPGRRWPAPSPVSAAALAVAVLLAAALVVQVSRDRGAAGDAAAAPAVSLGGSLQLANFRSEPFGEQRGWGDQQERNATGSGTVLLVLPDREVRGAAQVAFEAAYDGDDGNGYFHSWGDIELQLGSPAVRCRGSFGWSNYDDPPEGGGAVHARCDDGALLAARMVQTPQVPGPNGLSIDLRDGWYVAAPQQPH